MPTKKGNIQKVCEICGDIFYVYPCVKDTSKYCSRKCSNKGQKGRSRNKGSDNPMFGKPGSMRGKKHFEESKKKMSESHKKSISCQEWLKKLHKRTKGRHLSPKTEIKKGEHLSLMNEFKKGNIPWNKGKECPKGEKAANWKSGRIKDCHGYILIYSPNHPFRGIRPYIPEHRLVVEKYLGRYLKPEEVVHHVNENVADNRVENLMAFQNVGYHMSFHRYGPNKGIIFDGRKLSQNY